MPKTRRAFGIDPGLGRVGWAVIDTAGSSLQLIEFGCLTTSPSATSAQRLRQVHAEILALLQRTKPDVVAMEQLFFSKNVSTGISIGQARGVALLAAAQVDLPVVEFTPTNVKQAITGYGRADKRQIQHMVKMLLKLKEIPASDDAADAIAIALCGVQTRINLQ